jgi:hypothetical protein
MKDKNRDQSRRGPQKQDASNTIGNQQNTTQTGAQNAGGKNREQVEDPFADDLRKSGNRTSSNKKS